MPAAVCGSVLITVIRLFRLATCLSLGFGTALFFGTLPRRMQEALVRRWSRSLLTALGVRLRTSGTPIRQPGLLVANHVSWLDVLAIAALCPAAFVCKSEISAWPGIGWLLKRVGTVFIRRGSFRDVWRVNECLRASFRSGGVVAAFPEGTTTKGDDVLAFRPALFQPAVEQALPIHAVAICYSADAAAYVGETTFLQSLASIIRSRNLEIHVGLLRPLKTTGLGRKQAAVEARRVIRTALFGLQLRVQERPSASSERQRIFTAYS